MNSHLAQISMSRILAIDRAQPDDRGIADQVGDALGHPRPRPRHRLAVDLDRLGIGTHSCASSGQKRFLAVPTAAGTLRRPGDLAGLGWPGPRLERQPEKPGAGSRSAGSTRIPISSVATSAATSAPAAPGSAIGPRRRRRGKVEEECGQGPWRRKAITSTRSARDRAKTAGRPSRIGGSQEGVVVEAETHDGVPAAQGRAPRPLRPPPGGARRTIRPTPAAARYSAATVAHARALAAQQGHRRFSRGGPVPPRRPRAGQSAGRSVGSGRARDSRRMPSAPRDGRNDG